MAIDYWKQMAATWLERAQTLWEAFDRAEKRAGEILRDDMKALQATLDGRAKAHNETQTLRLHVMGVLGQLAEAALHMHQAQRT
jgi:hypothetical protein